MKRTVKEMKAMLLILIAKIAKKLFLFVEIKRTGIQIRNQTFFPSFVLAAFDVLGIEFNLYVRLAFKYSAEKLI